MNHTQIAKNNMYGKVNTYFDDTTHSIVWKQFERLVDEVTKFKTNNATLASYIQQHKVDTSGVTQTKNTALNAMVSIVVRASQKAYVWALDNSNQRLAAIFDVQTSTFSKANETTVFAKAKTIRDTLTQNIESMKSVELTPADLTAINAAISAYEAAIGTTGNIQSHKTAGTKGIVDVQKKMDQSLVIIDNLMVSHYKETNADMVQEYLLNRIVEKMPTHHSGISIHVTDATTGEELEGAVLAIGGKTSTTDIDGDVEIIKITPNTYNAVVSFNGYASQTTKVVIERGKILDLEVKLVKA